MNTIKAEQLLAEMQLMAAQAKAKPEQTIAQPESNQAESFSNLLVKAIEQVNDLQMQSGDIKEAYVRGEPGVNLADVMIASQKANIAFQATLQVRNRLVQAYQDIMNMPV